MPQPMQWMWSYMIAHNSHKNEATTNEPSVLPVQTLLSIFQDVNCSQPPQKERTVNPPTSL